MHESIRKLFVANRGEIAVRIIRAARELGMNTVLGCSAADIDSLAARMADEVVTVGGERELRIGDRWCGVSNGGQYDSRVAARVWDRDSDATLGWKRHVHR